MKNKSSKPYYEYLDTYRFIAVTLVIFSHWLPTYFGHLWLSKIGVDMFFVLSGFLITENLLKQRTTIDTGKGLIIAFKTFYIRRSLRIFPIYWIAIFFFLLVPVGILADNFLWYFFYGVNYLIIKQLEWPGMFSHLWSLAVEEQFYLLWPVLVFLTPFKWIDKILCILITFSIIFIAFSYKSNSYTLLSLQACISTLCIGSLLAYFKNSNATVFRILRFDWLLFVGLAIMIYIEVVYGMELYWFQLITASFSFYFIKLLITRKNNWLDLFFANRLTSFLGKISYGLYLYHNFIPWLLNNLNGTENRYVLKGISILPEIKGGIALFIQHWILLLLISIISWFLIEKPIIKFKTRFAY